MQSGYRKYHSTEKALLRVMSDVYAAADERRVTLLALLDLSAAFHCVDHDILLRRLGLAFGIEGSALAWLSSILSARTRRVYYLGQLPEVCHLLFGVLQGSVLGLLLFLLYVAEVAKVLAVHGFKGRFYADDTQPYISVPAAYAVDAALRLSDCIVSIESWMSSHRLKMNPTRLSYCG